ncbi:MAG: response regulator [Duganella sp.]
MRILIVDDERPARDKLRRMLALEPDVTAIGEARDGVEALECLAAFAPDLLLLDIQMPEISGLDVAASLPASPSAATAQTATPLVVFVTAYDEYALRAFDANAIDYLLKPFDQVRLRRALDRAQQRLAPSLVPSTAAAAGATTAAAAGTTAAAAAMAEAAAMSITGTSPATAPTTAPTTVPVRPAPAAVAPGMPLPAVTQLLVPERGGMRIVRVDQLQWIETADNYVVLHTADGQPLMRQTLAGLLDKLGHRFVRCHRRAAVQVDLIASLQSASGGKGDGELLLRGGARVPCSRQYRNDVLDRLRVHASGSPQGHPGSPPDAGR